MLRVHLNLYELDPAGGGQPGPLTSTTSFSVLYAWALATWETPYSFQLDCMAELGV